MESSASQQPWSLLLRATVLAAVAACAVASKGHAYGVWPASTKWHFESEACLKEPWAVAAALVNGPTAKCVDNSVLVRINIAYTATATKNEMIENENQNYAFATTFWSYDANIAKYIRIGLPDILGNWNEVQPGSNGTAYANPGYEGVRYMRNYLAMLEQIGYSSSDSNARWPHLITVAKRGTTASSAVSFLPKWKNLGTYFTAYVRTFGGASYKTFQIDSEVVNLLTTTPFANLTGCLPACMYQDSLYGVAGVADWAAPTVTGVRTTLTTCTVPDWASQWLNASACYATAAGQWCGVRAVPTEPTQVNANDGFCDPTFAQYRDAVNAVCDTNSFDPAVHQAVAVKMADLYRSAVGWRAKAQAFRAYLLTYCAGGYNPLFSGDGFTYTANGGLLGATGQEIVTGYSRTQDLQDLTYVFFCPFNLDGSANPGGRCNPAQVGTCSYCSGVNGTEYPTPLVSASPSRKA